MPKGTYQAEATLNSKPVALIVIELHCLKASVRQSVRRHFYTELYNLKKKIASSPMHFWALLLRCHEGSYCEVGFWSIFYLPEG